MLLSKDPIPSYLPTYWAWHYSAPACFDFYHILFPDTEARDVWIMRLIPTRNQDQKVIPEKREIFQKEFSFLVDQSATTVYECLHNNNQFDLLIISLTNKTNWLTLVNTVSDVTFRQNGSVYIRCRTTAVGAT